jgi:uncharacterized protein YecT (DUF1311 family)
MKTTIALSLTAIFLAWIPYVHSASFDCAKAKTKIEKLICANPKFSQLDEKVSALYKKVLEQSPVPEDTKEQQREWVKDDRNLCKDAACLERAYTRRISDLEEDLKRLPFKPALEKPFLSLPAGERYAAGLEQPIKKVPFELIGRIASGHDAAGANYIIISAKTYYTIRYGWGLTDEQKRMLDEIGDVKQYVLLKGQLVTYKDGSKGIDSDSEVQIFAQSP